VEASCDVDSSGLCSLFWRCDGRRDMDSIFAAEVVWYGRESGCMRQPEKQRNTQVDARHAPRAQPRIGKAPRDFTSANLLPSCIFHFTSIHLPFSTYESLEQSRYKKAKRF
jgi:hypothetical protein